MELHIVLKLGFYAGMLNYRHVERNSRKNLKYSVIFGRTDKSKTSFETVNLNLFVYASQK